MYLFVADKPESEKQKQKTGEQWGHLLFSVSVFCASMHGLPFPGEKPHENQKLTLTLKSPLKIEMDISREKAPGFKKWFDR